MIGISEGILMKETDGLTQVRSQSIGEVSLCASGVLSLLPFSCL
jgi:hypothetical protein